MGDSLDVLIVGSGVAGLTAAVKLATAFNDKKLRVGVLTKGALDDSTTRWAQGGVAAVLGSEEDSVDLHLADTIKAGDGLCDIQAVGVLVKEGPTRVQELISLGAVFDRGPEGQFSLAKEGGHSKARVLHANGLATGAEIERALVEAVKNTVAKVFENWTATALKVNNNKICGVEALDESGKKVEVEAGIVVLATGGAGQMFSVTTNPYEATGDGIAMALRAGAFVADIEFIQFHPTALYHPKMPKPLLSEALRGHGAKIRDSNGERFVDELLPRDKVSYAMSTKMAEQNCEHLYLDATELSDFAVRFPTIFESLKSVNLDPSIDWIPIAPAAHYMCGGIITDLNGATSIDGLFAAGEIACTGIHGANRLASNSLLEGMVFGARLVEAILSDITSSESSGVLGAIYQNKFVKEIRSNKSKFDFDINSDIAKSAEIEKLRSELQHAMSKFMAVRRDPDGMRLAQVKLDEIYGSVNSLSVSPKDTVEYVSLGNLITLSQAVVESALERKESRGCHFRSDLPSKDDINFLGRIVHK
jgi:L-aspartate oxidase